MKFIVALVAFIISLTTISAARSALTDDLVALYEFENSFLDSSASLFGNHGTPVNSPTFTSGKIGQAMYLPNTRDYMTLNPAVLTDLNFGDTTTGTATDFSVSMWIRQDNNLSDPAVFSNKDWNNGNNTGINWAPKGNGIFDLNTKGTTGVRRDLDTAANSAPLGVGIWSLVTMTVDRDAQTKLYINGVNKGTIPVTSLGSFNSGLPWNVGQDGTGNYGTEFTGAVDELAIWRRALSATEANQLWNSGAGITLGGQVVETTLKLVIDRQSGAMQIENNTGQPQDLIGYQITSKAGAFDQSDWTPISGRLDAMGNQTIDADDPWIVATSASSVSDLSEISLGTGTIPAGVTVELGNGNWAKYYRESSDLSFEYAEPGNQILTQGKIEFISGSASYGFADMNFDGSLDSRDWTKLQSGFGMPLAGLSQAQSYRLSDLNNDGKHSLDDILEFRLAYDAAHAPGAFEAMLRNVPEPATSSFAVFALSLILVVRRGKILALLIIISIFSVNEQSVSAARLFSQNFDSLPLGPKVDEALAGTNVWTDSPPAGWSIDNSAVPNGGVTEWSGWAFTDKSWWTNAAGDQGRSEFSKGSGTVAVADPDEWDDLPHDTGTYNTFLRTPAISLSGVAAAAAQLRFDSSWLPEDFQTANVTVSYDGGSPIEVLRWTSETIDVDYKPGATNETVTIPLSNPANASNMVLNFGMADAGNDWWWAIDNIEVVTPLTLQVNVQTGVMKLLGDASLAINGYEIKSALGSLNPAGWLAGNLDSQNVGTPVSPAADFSGNLTVDSADLVIWRAAYGLTAAGDADGDGDSDGQDFLRWQRDFGQVGDPASTWLTFLATSTQFVESYLTGNSTFAADKSLGVGYDVNDDRRDLEFYYIDSDNQKREGLVQYVGLGSPFLAVPEPAGGTLLSLVVGFGLCFRGTPINRVMRKTSSALRSTNRLNLPSITTISGSRHHFTENLHD